MPANRSNRVVRLLTAFVTIIYFAAWFGFTVVLIVAPVLKLLGVANADTTWSVGLPLAVNDSGTTVVTSLGAARLEVEDVSGSLEFPLDTLPWWLIAVLWTHMAVGFGLVMLFLHNLRRIFQRVRDGVPFDAQNALRLRRLGVLLLTLAVWDGLAELVASTAVRKSLESGTLTVPGGIHFEIPLILVALVLTALAEVFRRGAELEHEQSLVV